MVVGWAVMKSQVQSTGLWDASVINVSCCLAAELSVAPARVSVAVMMIKFASSQADRSGMRNTRFHLTISEHCEYLLVCMCLLIGMNDSGKQQTRF